MSTISNTIITSGIILGTVTTAGTFASPLTITASGTITASSGRGVYASGGYAYVTLVNQGTIIAAADYGVDLSGAGYVDNAGGLIQGTRGVVMYTNAGTVTNSGRIVGTGTTIVDAGIRLNAGGSVTNTGTGQITGFAGVYLGAAGSVTNSGTVIGNGTGFSKNAAVDFQQGGSVDNTGGLLQGYRGVEVYNAAGTITNAGTIEATGTGISSDAVYFNAGGRVANDGGLITGYYEAITGGTYVYNSGTLISSVTNAGWAVALSPGGIVVNTVNGLIEAGHAGIGIFAGAGTLTNDGQIVGTYGNGVALYGGGSSIGNTGRITGATGIYIASGTVTNSGTIVGTGSAGVGVDLGGGGTVVDSGTISAAGASVLFGGSGNLLVLEHGYKLAGSGVGGGSASTLELAGTVGAAVTANYNGLSLSGFGDVLFGPGGHDTLDVSNTGGTLLVTLSGFIQNTETVDLTGLAGGTLANGGTASGGQLVVSNGSETVTLNVDGSDAAVFAASADGAAGTDITPVCYRRGTLILTPRGEVAIEDLKIGDELVTLSGRARPIRWIGHRAYDGRFVADNKAVLPICVTAGALCPGIPARDLFMSPEHSLYFDGVLVQAKHLVNGATIVQPDAVESLEYFHLELDSHDIVFADGAAAESYVDCDNRWMFHNGAEYAVLYPDDDRPAWAFCLPRLEWGDEALAAIRAGLLARAEALGHDLTADPDLHLVVDDEIVRPETVSGGLYRFALPAGAGAAWLVSRSSVPAEIEADASDTRRLGVALERLALSNGDLTIEAWHGHEALAAGFHAAEATHRWTDGRARLPDAWLRLFPDGCELDVHLGEGRLAYRLPPPGPAGATAAA